MTSGNPYEPPRDVRHATGPGTNAGSSEPTEVGTLRIVGTGCAVIVILGVTTVVFSVLCQMLVSVWFD